MIESITWHIKQIKIVDLKDYPYNPRRISKNDFERLVNDIKQDGYHNRIIVNIDNTILGGHSRKKALIKAGFSEQDGIEVLYPSRNLSEEEIKRIIIRDNLPFGEFDFDILGNNFNMGELLEWGMPSEWIVENNITSLDSSILEEGNKLCNKCPYKKRENDNTNE